MRNPIKDAIEINDTLLAWTNGEIERTRLEIIVCMLAPVWIGASMLAGLYGIARWLH